MQYFQFRRLRKISLRASLSALLLASAIACQSTYPWKVLAQSPNAEQSATCQQDRSNTIYQISDILMERFAQELASEHYEAATATFLKILEVVSLIPIDDMRAGHFATLVASDSEVIGSVWLEHTRWLGQMPRFTEAGQADVMAKALDRAVQIAQTFDGNYRPLRIRSLISIARGYRDLDRPEQASHTLTLALAAIRDTPNSQQSPPLQVNMLLAIAQTYRVLGDLTTARTLWQQAQATAARVSDPNSLNRTQALAQVGIAYADADERTAAQSVARQLVTVPMNQGLVLQAIAESYLRANQLQQARAIAATIQDHRAKASTLSAIAQYAVRHGSTSDQAIALFLEAVQAIQDEPANENLRLSILDAFAQWYPDAALPLIQQLSSPYQEIPLLGQIAIAYHGSGQTEKATTVITQIKTSLQPLDRSWHNFYANQVVEKAVAIGDYYSGLWLATELTSTSPEMRSSIIRRHLISALFERGEVSLLGRAVEAIPEDDIGLKTGAMETLATAYVKIEQLDRAEALLNSSQGNDRLAVLRWVQLQSAIARELILTGNLETGNQRFVQAQQKATAQTDPQARAEALGKVILALTQAQRPISDGLMQSLQTTTQSLTPFIREVVLTEIITPLLEANRYDVAFPIALSINPNDSNQQEILLNRVAEGALKVAQYNWVLKVIEQLQSPVLKVIHLTALSDRYILDRRENEPVQALDQAVPIARTIPGEETIETPTGADGLTSIPDDFDRGSLLEAIALRYTILGRANKAAETVALIQEPALRDRINQRLRCYQ